MNHSTASVQGVSKRFGATCALDGVDFDVMPGESHALVGENGAGKSTLVRLLGGVYRPDQGEITVDGQPRRFANPHDAIAAGIATIPQELRLVPALTIAENISLGDPPLRRSFGIPVIDQKRMREEARAQLGQLEFVPDVDMRVDQLSFAERQLVAIAKALRKNCRLLILDEPTAALESREIDRLFAVLEGMKRQGTAIIYVSHRLNEIVALADRCTVLRDGRVAAVSRRGEFSATDLMQAMTGNAEADFEINMNPYGKTLLEDIDERADSIRLRANEIVGLAGLLGSGTTRVLQRLFGVGGTCSVVRASGERRLLANPTHAVHAGIGMVPGERRLGLIMSASVRDNIILPSLDRLARGGILNHAAGDQLVVQLMDLLDIRPRRPEMPAAVFSGGNQQKVILAKWLAREVGVLLLDEPTQGVDVGAKAQIHALIRDFARKGGGVLVSSSDLSELSRLADSVLAMRRGHVTKRIERSDLNENLLQAAIGG
jgi:ribose transport system ATP-binding protein